MITYDKIVVFIFSSIVLTSHINCNGQNLESDLTEWLKEANRKLGVSANRMYNAEWEYTSDLTKEKGEKSSEESVRYKEVVFNISQEARDKFNETVIKQQTGGNWTDLQRQFKLLTTTRGKLSDTETKESVDLVSSMQSHYSEAKVKDSCGTEYYLEGSGTDLTGIISTSTDYDQLAWAWRGFRDQNKAMKKDYERFVELQNKLAKSNGKKNMAEIWWSAYDPNGEDIPAITEKLYNEIKPLYEELQKYVRSRLISFYKKKGLDTNDKFPSSGHIPAHLLGNMWAQSWSNIAKIVIDGYDGGFDVTSEMIQQKWSIRKMYNISEEFFTSIGLFPMVTTFYDKSIIEKKDRNMVCHASAWDFFTGDDFRIKQCTKLTQSQLQTVHHEMGHIEYFQAYKDQPEVYRGGANPGFHEAVGDLIALSVSTPKHLKEIGLWKDEVPVNNTDFTIKILLAEALKKLPIIPWSYLLDKWRWDIFEGKTLSDKYNDEWWKLRCDLMGISPSTSPEKDDFDPGSKYHIPANVPYVRYFISNVIQFSFHKKLCEIAKQNGPLHECDIYRSKEAGAKLKEILSKGSSKPWQETLKEFLGTSNMTADAFLEYYQPLHDWLKKQNGIQNSTRWNSKCPDVSYKMKTWTPQDGCKNDGGTSMRGRCHRQFHLSIMVLAAILMISFNKFLPL